MVQKFVGYLTIVGCSILFVSNLDRLVRWTTNPQAAVRCALRARHTTRHAS